MTITRQQYWQTVGLLTLAEQHICACEQIEKALLVITKGDTSGHIGDAVYSSYTADELLSKLHITVETDASAEEGTLP